LKPSQEALSNHGIGTNDIVLVHWAETDRLHGNSFAQPIQVSEINETGITGVDMDGLYMEIGYRDIGLIEYPLPNKTSSDIGAGDLLPLLLCLGGICPTP